MKLLLLFMLVAVALADQETETTQERAAQTIARVFQIDPKESLECVNKSEATMEDLRYMQDAIHFSDTEATDMKSLKKATCAMVCSAQKIGIMVGGVVQEEELFKFYQKSNIPAEILRLMPNIIHNCKEQVTDTSDECMAYHKFDKCMNKRSQTMVQHK
ncbi:uncharacterized protein LOC143210201 isoform X1 [Lasioglossum baleicum]|uniref:uncharacterized protein LOC143210201 isoform X1 n=1 Tax=Lasioglossum baleicum TaxID=434251 RepID=UPI003FCC7C3D